MESKPNNRDTRRRFEQWASNPQCEANTISAVQNVRMSDATGQGRHRHQSFWSSIK